MKTAPFDAQPCESVCRLRSRSQGDASQTQLECQSSSLATTPDYGSGPAVAHTPPLLYNLDQDPSEKFDVASTHADVIAGIQRIADEHKKTVKPVASQLNQRLPLR